MLTAGRSHVLPAVYVGIFEKNLERAFSEAMSILLPWWGQVACQRDVFLTVQAMLRNSYFLTLKWNLFIRTVKHYTLCGSINYCVFYGLRSTQKSSSQTNSKSTVANWHTVSQTFTRNAHFVAWIKPWIRTIECFSRHRITTLFCFGI